MAIFGALPLQVCHDLRRRAAQVQSEGTERLLIDLLDNFTVLVWHMRLTQILHIQHKTLLLQHRVQIGHLWLEGSLDLLLTQLVKVNPQEERMLQHLMAATSTQALSFVL